ncbi:MAG: SDR family oxidoreductase [Hyphomicrobiaceae bacterium]
MTRIAVVAGALGIVGQAVSSRLVAEGWTVIGLSRRSSVGQGGARLISVDLADPADTHAMLGSLANVSHVFYCAYAPAPSLAEEARLNTRMLVHLVEALEAGSGDTLAHIQLMQGSKWYGNHLGPYRTPAREDDPRHAAPCFYYDQQDWLTARRAARGWTWSALRPHGVLGLALGSPMNQLTGIALYAVLCRELGLPLRWPGAPGAFDCVYQFTEAAWLAQGMVWAATTPAAADRAFNFTNGDLVRWRELWPAIARFFEMDTAPPQTISLAQQMADKEPVWAAIRERHRLAPYLLDELTNWGFVDFVVRSDFDQISDLSAVRRAGWTGVNPSEDAYLRQLALLRERRIIP